MYTVEVDICIDSVCLCKRKEAQFACTCNAKKIVLAYIALQNSLDGLKCGMVVVYINGFCKLERYPAHLYLAPSFFL